MKLLRFDTIQIKKYLPKNNNYCFSRSLKSNLSTACVKEGLLPWKVLWLIYKFKQERGDGEIYLCFAT